MLTAEIVSGTKGMLASLAAAIAEQATPDGETIPIELIQNTVSTAAQAPSTPRGRKTTTHLEGNSLEFALDAAVSLGKLRQKQDYQMHEVLLEYVALRQAIWDTLRAIAPDYEVEPSLDLSRYVDRLFDELLIHTVEAYYEAGVRDLEKRAIRDPLTQLYNKEYFAQRLHEEMRRALRHRQSLTLAMMDMDRLKEVNDTYGHQAGDAMIKAVTKAICDTCRQIDIPCRYGGDEFVVILPETTKAQAMVFVERLLRAVRDTTVVIPHAGSPVAEGEAGDKPGEPVISVPTLSVGLASFPEDGRNPETLISKADAALYRAKHLGRNVVSG